MSTFLSHRSNLGSMEGMDERQYRADFPSSYAVTSVTSPIDKVLSAGRKE